MSRVEVTEHAWMLDPYARFVLGYKRFVWPSPGVWNWVSDVDSVRRRAKWVEETLISGRFEVD